VSSILRVQNISGIKFHHALVRRLGICFGADSFVLLKPLFFVRSWLARLEFSHVDDNLTLIDPCIPKSERKRLANHYFRRQAKFDDYSAYLCCGTLAKIEVDFVLPDDFEPKCSIVGILHMVDPCVATAALVKLLVQHGLSRINLFGDLPGDVEKAVFTLLKEWSAAGDGVRLLSPSKVEDGRAALHRLENNETLVSFVDMPCSLSRTGKAYFFGREAWFAHDLIELASQVAKNFYIAYLESDPSDPLRYTLRLQRSDSVSTEGHSQNVASILERQIRKFPSDWDFIYSFRSYFRFPGAV
jgi:hypothetical protein